MPNRGFQQGPMQMQMQMGQMGQMSQMPMHGYGGGFNDMNNNNYGMPSNGNNFSMGGNNYGPMENNYSGPSSNHFLGPSSYAPQASGSYSSGSMYPSQPSGGYLGGGSHPNSHITASQSHSHGKGITLRLRGVPFQATTNEIEQFFSGFNFIRQSIRFGKNRDGRKSGEAWVEFVSNQEALRALKERDKQNMGHRYIELFMES
eukprot:TRINITY_DN2721_c0_g2_i3.p1 TRINITY_DN2721_c0_g2~~TRINITY_DN2721_c0_g2_i3.p1  ORF type:complete len:203 (+),score=32.57 TRINITY_DN2721_c0_g2_i3:315-923(+)